MLLRLHQHPVVRALINSADVSDSECLVAVLQMDSLDAAAELGTL